MFPNEQIDQERIRCVPGAKWPFRRGLSIEAELFTSNGQDLRGHYWRGDAARILAASSKSIASIVETADRFSPSTDAVFDSRMA